MWRKNSWGNNFIKHSLLSQQLGLGSQLKEWFQDATSAPYGHLLIEKQLIC